MEGERTGVPFPVKAAVVCGLLAIPVILLAASLAHPSKRTPNEADRVVEQDSVIGTALTPRDGTNLNLIELVNSGQADSTRARTLTAALETADQTAISQLADESWLPQSQAQATHLIAEITAQLNLLESAGDTPAAVDDIGIGRATGRSGPASIQARSRLPPTRSVEPPRPTAKCPMAWAAWCSR